MATTLESVVEILKNQGFNADNITPESTLAEIGLDSLDVVEAVMACEDKFDIEIDADVIPTNIAQVIEVIEKALA